MVPDPGALPRHCRELPGPVVRAGVGGLIAGAVDAGVPLDARAALASQCLVDLQGTRRGCTVGATEHRGERDTVLDCLVGALTAMRQHWMRGISKQRQAPARPGRQRLAVVQPPSKCLTDLCDNSLNSRVPARELGGERARITRCRPRLLHLLVGLHEADIVDELAGAYRIDENMLAGSKPV